MEENKIKKAFEVANFEPENGYKIVLNRGLVNSMKEGNGKVLESIIFRKPHPGVIVDSEKILITDDNPIPEERPNQRAMFDRGDIIIMNREFRESFNIAPRTKLKTFIKFRKTGKGK